MRKKFFTKLCCVNLITIFLLSFNMDNSISSCIVADAKEVSAKKVYVGGDAIGIKINTKGILVVGMTNVETEDGLKMSPAIKTGIQIGDNILKADNNTINCTEDILELMKKNDGTSVKLDIERRDKKIIKYIQPIRCNKENTYKLGILVREGSSGIGTVTYYDDENHTYGALGHGISDFDTGYLIKLKDGYISSSEITNIKKSTEGEPGELRGTINYQGQLKGNIKKNTLCGIFGNYHFKKDTIEKVKEKVEIADIDEIKIGKAYIYTTIQGDEPKLYDINIDKIMNQQTPNTKSMQIRITDDRLLNKTGGIVQGMSGSPIIQDNKLIGAVTHVLVNKPQCGYGIYIKWMLNESYDLK
ncbi:SpoIVB peptidase. Serine peptidase. MEROPS family S55 [Hathewaya proteolytica DSM 3090]|uniref:SpoIVB peptidase. Serine peptidase. MEROPS family S55 n=1 Tax=Hathewaya proteolytica DSM 3090 TaxID=1121331 RepID=A0A1M6L446_9CLOT|nr:SpoIVB peptidase [Hathewaya proteolytica]SHJ65874.1 SpoIVB peptidase. Serine peptidase. MEROPS family S55 [Hathewaya proteolytica DSM 3090]